MTSIILAVSYGTLALALVSFAAGAVVSYLFLRANPNKKAVLDEKVTKFKERTDL